MIEMKTLKTSFYPFMRSLSVHLREIPCFIPGIAVPITFGVRRNTPLALAANPRTVKHEALKLYSNASTSSE